MSIAIAIATAVDLGQRLGNQSLALGELGFFPVLRVDSSKEALDELTVAARGQRRDPSCPGRMEYRDDETVMVHDIL